jgi:phage tail tape-measure protein
MGLSQFSRQMVQVKLGSSLEAAAAATDVSVGAAGVIIGGAVGVIIGGAVGVIIGGAVATTIGDTLELLYKCLIREDELAEELDELAEAPDELAEAPDAPEPYIDPGG